jgi:hypothetical protein
MIRRLLCLFGYHYGPGWIYGGTVTATCVRCGRDK